MIETHAKPICSSNRALSRACDRTRHLAYQAAWDSGFRAEAELLGRTFAPLAPHIEHIGTTAIAGSAARPIIDVLVAWLSPPQRIIGFEGCGCMATASTIAMKRSNLGTRLLVRWQRGLPTHHVHVVEYLGIKLAPDAVVSRRTAPDTRLAREYEWLRRRFAGTQPANRVATRGAKATFIASIVSQAH